MNSSNTIVLLLSGGGFVFLAALVAPIVSKRLNKATDAATSAKTLSETAVALTTEMKDRMVTAEKKCDKCIGELAKTNRRLDKAWESNDALIDAVTELLPLVPAGSEQTKAARAAIRAARRVRYDDV